MIRTWEESLLELGESALLGCIEQAPLRFTPSHERDVPKVRAAIRRAGSGIAAAFRSPVNRSAFLLGCLDYTESSAHEHLIVGYGFSHGSTTKIQRLDYVAGGRSSVPITPSVPQRIREHYLHERVTELILFHNHPRNFLNLFLDNPPLASRTDRDTAERWLWSLADDGRLLFYLGENGYVKRFLLPSVLTLLARNASPTNGRRDPSAQWPQQRSRSAIGAPDSPHNP